MDPADIDLPAVLICWQNNILLCYALVGNYPEYLQIQRCISKKVQGVTGIVTEDHYFESEYVTW